MDPSWHGKAALIEEIDRHLDRAYLVESLSNLAKIPTAVPLGFNTLMEPDDPKLVTYVQEMLRPELVRLGVYDLIDVPRNNLVIRVGTGSLPRSLLIQNYTPSQHHNLMDPRLAGVVANARDFGCDEPAIFGQGVSQNKAHQAVMLAVMKLLLQSDIELHGRLYWAINNEGRSSHACTEAIIGALDERPTFGVVQIGTDLGISLGNRGRVDVDIHLQGTAIHSSEPEKGLSAIEGAHEVMSRLKTLAWEDSHQLLGGRHAIVYKIRYDPVAPHTLPSDAYLTVDRRMLPGDDPHQATEEIRQVIGDLSPYKVSVDLGVYMLPALVERSHPGVRALQEANFAIRGSEADEFHGFGTFDAGGLCAFGIPTVMYGSSGKSALTDTDFVPISAVETEARVLAYLILSYLG